MDNIASTNQPPINKAEEIRNRFKVVGAPTPAASEKKDAKGVEAITARAKEKEEFYSGVGEERAANEKDKAKKEKAAIDDKKYKQTTIKLNTQMQKDIYEIEGNLLGEDVSLSYDNIMTAGIEKLKGIPSIELVKYLKSIKKGK
jgi:hypothetical protein